ncbi:MAG: uncharacterized protein A8A55_1957 [Amphiamblys sp. WSBS2006]|nr:MAG: uncharacterized protein A8A55_1957 [Amphiamblys sp. WSBS2006]
MAGRQMTSHEVLRFSIIKGKEQKLAKRGRRRKKDTVHTPKNTARRLFSDLRGCTKPETTEKENPVSQNTATRLPREQKNTALKNTTVFSEHFLLSEVDLSLTDALFSLHSENTLDPATDLFDDFDDLVGLRRIGTK